MEATDFKKALSEVLGSLEIKVDLSGTLSFNVKETPIPPIEPEPSTGPPIEPEPSVGPPIEPPIDPPTEPAVNTIFSQDFKEVPLDEAYTLTKARRDFGEDCKYSNGLGWKNLYNVKIVDDNDTRLMRVKTHRNEISPDYGFQFHKVLTDEEQRDEIYFSYNVIFSPYFEPVKGGKLPGLFGGHQTQWGKDTGFTCRMMFKQQCSLDFYIYWPDMDSQYGKHFGRFPDPETGEQFSFYHETEVWHNITQRLVLNTAVDKADGFVEVFIDGKFSKRVDDMRFRADMNVSIEEMAMTHFFGGNTQDWAPSKNQYIKIDDVMLFEIVETNGIVSPNGRDISYALPQWPKTS